VRAGAAAVTIGRHHLLANAAEPASQEIGMLRRNTEINHNSEAYEDNGFALAALGDEARRQTWTCAALCGLMLAALLVAAVAGTA
jgi:hypothetical protein